MPAVRRGGRAARGRREVSGGKQGVCAWLTLLTSVMCSASTLRAVSRLQSGRSTSELESERKAGHSFAGLSRRPSLRASEQLVAVFRTSDADTQFGFISRMVHAQAVSQPHSATPEDRDWPLGTPHHPQSGVQLAD